MSNDTEPKLEFLEKVESTIAGVIDFIKDFARTFAYLVHSPRRFGAKLSEESAKPDFVRPFTFLGICTFVAVRVLKLFVLAVLIFMAAFTKGCSAETYQEVRNPKLLDLLVLPSWEEIVSIGLPIIFMVLILAWLFNFLLIRNRESVGSRLAYVACYAIGFQYLIFLLLGAPLYGVVFEDWMDKLGAAQWANNKEDIFSYYSAAGLFVLVAWSTFVLAWLTRSQVRSEDWRLRFRGSFLLNLVIAPFLFCSLTLGGGFALAYPLANSEYKQKYSLSPYLLAAIVDETRVDGVLKTMTVALVNNTDQRLLFDGKSAEVTHRVMERSGLGRYEQANYLAEIVSMKPPVGPVLMLQPGEQSWLVLSLQPKEKPQETEKSIGWSVSEDYSTLHLKRVATADGPDWISAILKQTKPAPE